MKMRKWEELPPFMQCEEVKKYYNILSAKKSSLKIKRFFDIIAALVLLVVLAPLMFTIGVKIASESSGGIFYRQVRVTRYGKKFRIHKFRTMIAGADQLGTAVTIANDPRITPTGAFLRKYRLDELPQLFDILSGDMSFVGTRPEVPKYVKQYTKEMRATLLLPAGVTSEASIRYKDEAEGFVGWAGEKEEDVEKMYIKKILPKKMKYNLEGIRKFGLGREIKTMVRTIWAVIK